MSDQPKLVTLICWLNIVVGSVMFLVLPTFIDPFKSINSDLNGSIFIDPYGKGFQFVYRQFTFTPDKFVVLRLYVMILMCMISSIFMLRGANWARLLYVVLGGAHFIFSIPNQLILVYVMIVYLLFRPKCNVFFSR